MFGNNMTSQRKSPYQARAVKHAPKQTPEEETIGVDNVVGAGAGAISGAKTGASLGTAAAPFLAAVPVVGPALAAGAPTAGAVLGGAVGGLSGAASEKGSAVKNIKKGSKDFDLKGIRQFAAKNYFS